MTPTAPDIWRAGGFAAKHGAAYLSITEPTFFTIARAEKWPRKRIRGTSKIVYPRSLIRAYLANCPDAPPLSPAKPATGNAAKKKQEAA